MDEHCLTETASKGIDEHQCIVESKRAHHPVAVECTATVREILIGLQQTTVAVVDVANDVLVTTVGELIDQRVAIAGVELANELAVFTGSQTVVDRQGEE